MNHPFVDGNKRTAFAAMDTFLRLNGYALTLSDEQAYVLVVQIANGQVGKTELAIQLQQSVVIAEIEPKDIS
ncbi:MAG: type II toxin-antitoxin system death-on-curing family toxin [Leptolyngbyaceae cyanobacterium RU_5_1]|nr:type II toxin-antitoxin system death-on-curing family toxin [Leptolyngbyaceae cyanobacterium RU_5_1]